jgi:RNA polymerase sigma-70 factor (ECF subfamily)
MRRRYRDLLRAEIAETVATPEEVDDEIRFLLATLSG